MAGGKPELPPPPPGELEYRIEKLNPMSVPKGKKLQCQVSDLPVTVALVTPYATLYFHSARAAKLALDAVLKHIVHLFDMVAPTKDPPAESQQERLLRLEYVGNLKHALVDYCNEIAAKHIANHDFELAHHAAQYALRFATEHYGSGRIELVPAYLCLADAHLGLQQFAKAEEFLTHANWSVLKTEDSNYALHSRLRRVLGKLFASQGRYDEALQQLAEDVYYTSLAVGPENIDTAYGYFQLAAVFHAMDRVDDALAMYDKVTELWFRCLYAVSQSESEFKTGDEADFFKDNRKTLSESRTAAGMEMLSEVVLRRETHMGLAHISTAEARYVIGLLQFYCMSFDEARSSLSFAYEMYVESLGDGHSSTQEVLAALDALNKECDT